MGLEGFFAKDEALEEEARQRGLTADDATAKLAEAQRQIGMLERECDILRRCAAQARVRDYIDASLAEFDQLDFGDLGKLINQRRGLHKKLNSLDPHTLTAAAFSEKKSRDIKQDQP